ncbi:MAG: hypothetical protein AB7H93_10110 [Vicinamibacterales bacterium]
MTAAVLAVLGLVALAAPSAAAAQTADDTPWTAIVSGGETVVDLPNLEGMSLVTLGIGGTFQLTGAHPAAMLDIALPARGGIQPGTAYAPVRFAITWKEAGVVCTAAPGLQVTLDAVGPVRGRYEGPVRCRSRADARVTFDAAVSGVLHARGRRR